MASRLLLALTALFCLLLSLPSPATAANTVTFLNHCPFTLYYWVVGPSDGAAPTLSSDPYSIAVPGYGGIGTHTMLDTVTPDGGSAAGVCLKMRDLPHYEVAPSGILQAEYKLEPGTGVFWYDFSAIDCGRTAGPGDPWYCPFVRGGVKMWVPGADDKRCPVASCGGGDDWTCEKTYLDHGSWAEEPSYSCGIGSDIVFETCTEGWAPQTVCKEHPEENEVPMVIPPPPYEPLPPSPPPYEPYEPEPAPLPPPPPYEPEPPVYEPEPPYEPEPEPEPCPSPEPPVETFIPSFSPPLPPVINELPPEALEPYNPSPNPPTYPPPPSYPSSTTCFDRQCRCYLVHQPWTYPDQYPPGTPDCSGYVPEMLMV